MAEACVQVFGLKCRQCRSGFLAEHEQFLPYTENLWLLNEDNLPYWVMQKIEDSGWTKGRLHCPKCQARIGNFDFVGASQSHVHLAKSKVDLCSPTTTATPCSPSTSSDDSSRGQQNSSTDDSSEDNVSEDNTLSSTSESAVDQEDVEADIDDDDDDKSSALSCPAAESSTSSSSLDTSVSSTELHDEAIANLIAHLDTEEAAIIVSSVKKKKMRVKRMKRKELEKQQKIKSDQEQKIKEILAGEPELDNLDSSLICPVCLDLLFDPYCVVPCKHTFCEPCLRRLGSKNPMNTLCPMCRQRVAYCESHSDLAISIKESYPELYGRRKKLERSTNVFSLPLPWRPGWRNLVSGRPLGGNHFAGNSMADFVRAFLQQLPYYVPPVVIANLINLLFFVFLLGAVEIAPLLLGLIVGKAPPLTPAVSPKGHSIFNSVRVVDPAAIAAAAAASAAASASGPPGSGEGPHEAGSSGSDDGIPSSSSLEDLTAAGSGSILDILSPAVEDESSVMVDEVPLPPTYLPPEAVSPAMDATFYYVICTMSLVAAAFGNFILIHQQPALGLIPQGTFLDRIYNHGAYGRLFQRFSDLFLILVLSCVPLLLLPLILPTPGVNGNEVDPNWYRAYLTSAIQAFFGFIDVVQSYFTVQSVIAIGLAYWVGTVYLDYGNDE